MGVEDVPSWQRVVIVIIVEDSWVVSACMSSNTLRLLWEFLTGRLMLLGQGEGVWTLVKRRPQEAC